MRSKLSKFVATERKRLGYTQVEFSERVGVSLSFLRSLEQGKKSLRMDKVQEVLEFFGYEIGPVKKVNE